MRKFARSVFGISSELNPKRNLTLDYIRGIVMMLVLYQHSFAPMNEYVMQFHMPALFVLSGYTEFCIRKKTAFRAYLKAKFLRLIVPYFCFEILYLVLYFLLQLWKGLPIAPATEILESILTVSLNPHYLGLCGRFWFLPTMFFASIVSYVLRTYVAYKDVLWAKLLCIMVLLGLSYGTTHLPQRLPFTIDITFLAAAWILIGHSAGRFLNRLTEEKNILCDVMTFVVGLAVFIGCNLLAAPKCWMYTNHYEDYAFMIPTALSGTVLIFLVAKWLRTLLHKVKTVHNFVLWYSLNSLAIYPIHMGIMAIFTEVLHDRTWYLMLAAMLFGTVPLVNIVRNYMPFMLGNRRKGKS